MLSRIAFASADRDSTARGGFAMMTSVYIAGLGRVYPRCLRLWDSSWQEGWDGAEGAATAVMVAHRMACGGGADVGGVVRADRSRCIRGNAGRGATGAIGRCVGQRLGGSFRAATSGLC